MPPANDALAMQTRRARRAYALAEATAHAPTTCADNDVAATLPLLQVTTRVPVPSPPVLTRRDLRRQRVQDEAVTATGTLLDRLGAEIAGDEPAPIVSPQTRRQRRAMMASRDLHEVLAEGSAGRTDDPDGPLPVPATIARIENAQTVEPHQRPLDLDFDFASVTWALSSVATPATPRDEAATATGAALKESTTTTSSADLPRLASPASTPRSAPGPARVPSRVGKNIYRWAPRLAVLAALGAATIVTPVIALAPHEHDEVIVAPLAQDSALDTLLPLPAAAASGPDSASDVAPTGAPASPADSAAELLAFTPLSDVRGLASASRSEGRSALPQCGDDDPNLANGTLAAMESRTTLQVSMPIQDGIYRFTSSYGPRWGAFHYGVDMAAPLKTPIRAVVGGEVVHAGGGLAGRSPSLVAIRSEVDGETVEVWYNHMFNDGVFVSEGDIVQVGDVIAEVGNNGNSTGPHLHLEIHTGNVEDPNSSAVDPLPWLRANNASPVTTAGEVCV